MQRINFSNGFNILPLLKAVFTKLNKTIRVSKQANTV